MKIDDMVQRIRRERGSGSDFLDLKTGSGGIIEAEFLVQALQMRANDLGTELGACRRRIAPARASGQIGRCEAQEAPTRFCGAANLCCVDMTTEASQRFRAIQMNNESLPSVLAIMNLTLSVATTSLLVRRFTHSTNGSLRRLNRGDD